MARMKQTARKSTGHKTRAPTRRKASEADLDTASNELPLKRRKLCITRSMHDVKFVFPGELEPVEIHGIKALFAMHSDVLRNMLYDSKMAEATQSTVIVDDITVSAFQFIKSYTHDHLGTSESLPPSFEHVVDVLYAAQKYIISALVDDCVKKILSVTDIDTFYSILSVINKYAPSTFESTVQQLMQSEFVQSYAGEITADPRFERCRTYQALLILNWIGEDMVCYRKAKQFCQALVKAESNANTEQTWQDTFRSHFGRLFEITEFSLKDLIEIGPDQAFDSVDLFESMEQKRANFEELYDETKSKYQKQKRLAQKQSMQIANLKKVNQDLDNSLKCLTQLRARKPSD